jgi:streptomycin 6-kinase
MAARWGSAPTAGESEGRLDSAAQCGHPTGARRSEDQPDAASEHEHPCCGVGGGGASPAAPRRPPRRALLLERLHAQTLDTLPDVDACRSSPAHPRIHVLPCPNAHARFVCRAVDERVRGTSAERRFRAGSLAGDHAGPRSGRTANAVVTAICTTGMCAADREPGWYRPKPMNGDPH